MAPVVSDLSSENLNIYISNFGLTPQYYDILTLPEFLRNIELFQVL